MLTIVLNQTSEKLDNTQSAYTGLSMNIWRAGDKSPVQRGFLINNVDDLLPALRFLSGLYNFCNFVIISF